MISTTRPPPRSACSWTFVMARSMNVDWSLVTSILMPGTSWLIRSISALMPVGDGDGVLAGLLVDAHADARASVDSEELAAILRRIDDLCDVAHVDRHAVTGHDDEVADVVEARELALASDEIGGIAL